MLELSEVRKKSEVISLIQFQWKFTIFKSVIKYNSNLKNA